jgi:hypothetical protein
VYTSRIYSRLGTLAARSDRPSPPTRGFTHERVWHVPEGGLHGFRNESGEKASMLILFAPGAPREDYFERVATTGRMSEEDRTEFYLRHDTFWV